MSWGYLTQLLEEVHRHSTFLSKLWITTFLIFRIVLTTVAGESIYYDEQGRFTCNTAQPGCENVCYDSFAPLSHVRFWVFQIIAVATPTILYLGFAVHRITRIELKRDQRNKRAKRVDRAVECTEEVDVEEEEVEEVDVEEEGEEEGKREPWQHNERWRIKSDGLMAAYTLQLLARTLAEMGFLAGQYLLYGLEVAPRFECVRHPCPHHVDCFVSRPKEKTIFLLLMYAIAALSLLLEVSEICYLGLGAFHDSLSGSRSAEGKQAALNDAGGFPGEGGPGQPARVAGAPPSRPPGVPLAGGRRPGWERCRGGGSGRASAPGSPGTSSSSSSSSSNSSCSSTSSTSSSSSRSSTSSNSSCSSSSSSSNSSSSSRSSTSSSSSSGGDVTT